MNKRVAWIAICDTLASIEGLMRAMAPEPGSPELQLWQDLDAATTRFLEGHQATDGAGVPRVSHGRRAQDGLLQAEGMTLHRWADIKHKRVLLPATVPHKRWRWPRRWFMENLEITRGQHRRFWIWVRFFTKHRHRRVRT